MCFTADCITTKTECKACYIHLVIHLFGFSVFISVWIKAIDGTYNKEGGELHPMRWMSPPKEGVYVSFLFLLIFIMVMKGLARAHLLIIVPIELFRAIQENQQSDDVWNYHDGIEHIG